MAKYRKLGREMHVRKAMLRALTTDLLYHGKITTTVTRAKEIRKFTEKLITLAVKEHLNYEEVTVTNRVARKDKNGKKVKEIVDGKKVVVYDTVQRTVKKNNASRLNAKKEILSFLYPVSEVNANGKRHSKEKVVMINKMFDEIAPKYVDRKGGYTRIIKIGMRKGDAAEMAVIELV